MRFRRLGHSWEGIDRLIADVRSTVRDEVLRLELLRHCLGAGMLQSSCSGRHGFDIDPFIEELRADL
jgi:hypothetical protein